MMCYHPSLATRCWAAPPHPRPLGQRAPGPATAPATRSRCGRSQPVARCLYLRFCSMAKKTRRQKQRAAARRPAASSPGAAGWQPRTPASTRPAEAVSPSPEDTEAAGIPAEPAAAAGAAGTRRRIERVSPTTGVARGPARPGRGPANAAAMFQPLESEDAAIPFDRVPYVPADLRRVAMMAAAMVVLIIIAALVVSHLVT